MATDSILSLIDAEIARLTQARALLANMGSVIIPLPAAATAKSPAKVGRKKKRTLSPEARKRIADAQRKRWAALKSKTKK